MFKINDLCRIPLDEGVYRVTYRYEKNMIIKNPAGKAFKLSKTWVDLVDNDNRNVRKIGISENDLIRYSG